MYLKRVELYGFKTFARKTVLEFPRGITAVVGPNGSGKSNIVDAVRWVLGEQSARALRGSKMEEVIFGGSDRRGSLSLAEVTLVFDNGSRRLPLEFEEVAVTRRIDRGGSSEYLLNGVPCRLKDLLDLFMGTGVGHGTYCIIGSDEIDLLLSSNPLDRRLMVEEVAAVNKYKYKKREARRKLDETERHLVRIHDLRVEVEGQLEGLAAQKERAERYFALKKEIDELTVALLLDALAGFDRRRLQLDAAREGIEQKRVGLEGALRACREETSRLDEELRGLRGKEGTLAAEQEEARLLWERKEGERKLLEEKRAGAAAMAGKLAAELLAGEGRREEIEAEEGRVREDLAGVSEELSRLRDEVVARREALEGVDDRDRERRRLHEDLAARQRELAARAGTATRERAEREERLAARREELARLLGELRRLEEASAALELERLRADAVREDRLGVVGRLREKLAAREEEAGGVRARREALGARLDELKEARGITAERLALLEELEANLEGFSEGAKEALKWGEGAQGVVGALGALLEVDKGFEQALDAVLGRHVQDIVVEAAETAERAIEFLKEERRGRATFLPLSFFADFSPLPDLPAGHHPGFVARALDVARGHEKIRPIIHHFLGKVVIFETLSAALAAAASWRELGFTLVTLEGELVASEVTGGMSRAKRETLFGRSREIRELRERLGALQAEDRGVLAELAGCGESLAKIEAEIEEVAGRSAAQTKLVEESERDLLVLATRREHLAVELERLTDRSGDLEAEAAALETDLAGRAESERELAGELSRVEEEILGAEAALLEGREEREGVQAALHEVEVLLAQQEEAHRGMARRLADLVAQREELATSRAARERERADLEERQSTLTREEEGFDELLASLRRREEEAGGLFAVVREAINVAEQKIARGNGEIEKLRRDEERLRERLHDLDLQRSVLDTQRAQEAERLQRDFPDLSGALPVKGRSYEGEVREAESRLKELEETQRSLGPVNFSAVEDYERQEERHRFLAGQEEDLSTARRDLEKIITDLDEKSITRFKETFEALNREFGILFTEMFKGGKGALRLTDPSNLLESGVDVMAQPPGKKMQNLHLLSSGEKALTGIAFLLAILRVKPSPFCLLDEIDAPLDDANIDRFASKLEEYAGASQFIVVTHNRKTMQTAHTLYGVTMEEPGISKIMSLRLEEFTRDEAHELVRQN